MRILKLFSIFIFLIYGSAIAQSNKISKSSQPKDNIIFMSNGGFSGLQNKVAQLLKNE